MVSPVVILFALGIAVTFILPLAGHIYQSKKYPDSKGKGLIFSSLISILLVWICAAVIENISELGSGAFLFFFLFLMIIVQLLIGVFIYFKNRKSRTTSS